MKCSSQRNCNAALTEHEKNRMESFNEVQFPKELQHRRVRPHAQPSHASMKCSSQRNCNIPCRLASGEAPQPQ